MEDAKKPIKPNRNTSDFTVFSFRPPPPAVNEISAADKLFHRGKLLPCKPITPPPPLAGANQTIKISPLRLKQAESPDSPDRRLRMASPDLTPAAAVAGKQSKRISCMFGVVRFPLEMEMKEIKIRQRRIGQSPPAAAEKGRRRGVLYWGIVQSLSCKAAESTAVSPVNAAG